MRQCKRSDTALMRWARTCQVPCTKLLRFHRKLNVETETLVVFLLGVERNIAV